MGKIGEVVFKTTLIYCVIAFFIDYQLSFKSDNNYYIVVAKMLSIYLFIPFTMAFIYWLYSIKLLKRLHNTSFVTGFDLWIVSGVIALLVFLIQKRTIFQLPIFHYIIEVYWFFIAILAAYSVWLIFRCNCKVELNNNGKVIHVDKPAEIDKLDRKFFVDEITDTIKNSQVEGTFVLAITGEWGEGKSTLMSFILKNLSDKKKILAYCFDPWYFNSQESLVANFFHTLYAKLNEEKFVLSSQVVFSIYSRLIGGKELGVAGKIIDSFGNYSGQLKNIKEEIKSCLRFDNRRVVIFIDNLDRLEREELLLTFKLVNLCADFPNIMFVLLYDKFQVYKKISPGNTEYAEKFLEKIIHGEFVLPIADSIMVRKYWEEMLYNLAGDVIGAFDNNDSIVWAEAIEHVARKITNLRNAKEHVNWLILKMPLFKKNNLNFIDFFIVESIARFYPKAYQDIYDYSAYLPYYAKINPYLIAFDKDKVVKARKQCYEKIISAYPDLESEVLRKLLSMLFTSCRNYFNGNDDLYGGENGKERYFESRPIDDQRYFNSYFSYLPTAQLIIAKELSIVLQEIKSGGYKLEDAIQILNKVITALKRDNALSEMLIHLRQNVGILDSAVLEPIVKALVTNSRIFQNESSFLGISDRSRAEYLVVDIIRSCPDKKSAQSLLEDIANACEDFGFARAVLYHFPVDEKIDGMDIVLAKDAFASHLNKLIDQNHNFFIPQDHHGDFWAILDYADNSKIPNYLSQIIESNLESLPGFLDLLVQKSISSHDGLQYAISKEYYKLFGQFISYEFIDELVIKYTEKHSGDNLPRSLILFKDYRRQQEVVEAKQNLPDETQ
jgi:hypothetical protein